MSKKHLLIALIGGMLCLNGCAYIKHISDLDSEPIYITVYNGYPPVKEVIFGNQGAIDYKVVDERIEAYLNKYPKLEQNIVNTIRHYSVSKGMTKEQVAIIATPNVKKFNERTNQEVWIYGSVVRDGRMVKIIFVNDVVTQINLKYWTYTIVE